MHRCCSLRNLSSSFSVICIVLLLYLLTRNITSNEDNLATTTNSMKKIWTKSLVKEIDWQEVIEVGGANHINNKTKMFVYSAFVDKYNGSNVLRVIAVTPTFSKRKLHCHVFNEELNLIGVYPGKIITNKEGNTALAYSTAFILCNLDSVPSQKFYMDMKFVSISPIPYPKNLSNLLRINPSLPEDVDEPYTFGLCVQPLFNYDKVFEFIQWFEFHKMMGVTHFTFYNISIGPQVSCLMRSKALNEATPINILKWTTPVPDYGLLHINGQVAQINDCAFRYRGVSKYLLLMDVDECIVPNYVHARNYEDLLQVINANASNVPNLNESSIVQYEFRSAFFGSDFGSFPQTSSPSIKTGNGRPKKEDLVHLEDLTLYKYVKRQKNLIPHKTRSKYITIPRGVIEPGIHFLYEAVGNRTEFQVSEDFAFLHHYRPYRCWIAPRWPKLRISRLTYTPFNYFKECEI